MNMNIRILYFEHTEFSAIDVPLCPLCDQPINYVSLSAVMAVHYNNESFYCLAHKDCIDEME